MITKEQILAMPAGRELDAMIAEHIFGWRRITGPKTDYDGPCEYGEVLISPEMTDEDAFRMMPPKGAIPFYYFVHRKWSTDISAAWEVEEKMLELGKEDDYGFELYLITGACEMSADRKNLNVFKLTHASPEQRCKAALLAVTGL